MRWAAVACAFNADFASSTCRWAASPSLRDRGIAFTGPVFQLLLPCMEDFGARSPQLCLGTLGFCGGSSSRRIGLLDRPFGPLAPLAQHPCQEAVNQESVKNYQQKKQKNGRDGAEQQSAELM